MRPALLLLCLNLVLSTALAQSAAPVLPALAPVPVPAPVATASGPAEPGGGPLDVLARVVEQDFQACGQVARVDPVLNEVAGLMLRGFKLSQATGQLGYRAKRGGAELLTGVITPPRLAAALERKCGQRLGYSRYGLAFNGMRLALVYAEPASVDLTRRQAWLDEFLALTNAARRQGQRCGETLYAPAGPLRWDDRLTLAATVHAAQLVTLNFRGHVAPDTGEGPLERARKAGFTGTGVGETIAYDSLTPAEAIQGLLASPGHCRILMNPDWTVMGADVVNGLPTSAFTTYWVQVFGKG